MTRGLPAACGLVGRPPGTRLPPQQAAAIATATTAHTARASHASSRPSVTSQDTPSAAPSSRLATPYMPTGKTMLHSPGS